MHSWPSLMTMFRHVAGRWLAVWLSFAFSLVGRAIGMTQGPVAQLTPTGAVLRWSTDHASGARVYYGTDVKHLELRVDPGVVGADHEVTLSGLRPGTTYWYSVGTARTPLATNSFTTPPGEESLLRTTPPNLKSTMAEGPEAARPSAAPAAFDPTRYQVPPARVTWGAPRTLQDHFDRHGADFAAKNPEDYAAKAWLFLRRAAFEGLPAKLDADGVLRVYEAKTKTFASYNRDLTAKTFFKPGRPNYFEDQPGKSVNLKSLVK